MQIYLARNQVQAGPYTLDQLNKMLATQQVELDDLMWHEGMTQWQRVGDLTHETHHYYPNSVNKPSNPSARTTVSELYGSKKRDSVNNIKPAFKIGKSVSFTKDSPVQLGKNELASVISRVLAILIDQILAFLCLVPIFSGMSLDFEKLQAAQEDPALLMDMMNAVPTHLTSMTALMFIALLCVQIFMLMKRGQSLGKLVMGVRILDINSQKLPSVTNIILLRTIVTNLAYSLPYIGHLILLGDFIAMLIDKSRRSLHDRLAKTYVVKADESQLKTPKK